MKLYRFARSTSVHLKLYQFARNCIDLVAWIYINSLCLYLFVWSYIDSLGAVSIRSLYICLREVTLIRSKLYLFIRSKLIHYMVSFWNLFNKVILNGSRRWCKSIQRRDGAKGRLDLVAQYQKESKESFTCVQTLQWEKEELGSLFCMYTWGM